ncbi:MAG: dihydropteroate synthase [bacterium]
MSVALMGIVNVTPDSFSDGGLYLDPEVAIRHGRDLAAAGADWLDVGGESTRPGSEGVSLDEELERVIPVVQALAGPNGPGVPVSIDTSKAEVARQAVAAGARMINDVTALRGDAGMPAVCAESGVEVCLMHMLGEPRTMQEDPRYDDVVAEVRDFLAGRMQAAVEAGVAEEKILLDPGIGFGKTLEHNLALLRGLSDLATLGRPLLVGPSRKRFIGELAGNQGEADDRLGGTVAACIESAERGAAILRVHDVAPVRQALAVAGAISGG